jgi:hypothetical protein
VSDDDKLEAVTNRSYPIQAEISQRFAGKLSEFKSHVKLNCVELSAADYYSR